MQSIKLIPNKLEGKVNAPSSKSLTHRAIISASLTYSTSYIKNVTFSEDIFATIDVVRSLGAKVEIYENKLSIDGLFKNIDIFKQTEINNVFDKLELYANESGSTLRFLIPIALCFTKNLEFKGEKSLLKRPLNVYYNIFDEQEIKYFNDNNKISINGELQNGEFIVDGSVSSQFISGLLFATPLLKGNSIIKINGDLQSKSYISLTLAILEKFGIEIKNNEYKTFKIKGNQNYKATDYSIEGDFSQAAVFEVANFIGNKIKIENINYNSLQGDRIVIDIIDMFGYDEVVTVNGSDCPDIIPILALGACFRNNKTIFKNVERLKIKECDRLIATYEILTKLGAKVEIIEDCELVVYGNANFYGDVTLDSYNDHRMAMLVAIASTKCENPVILRNYKSVGKSFPNFFEIFKSLGGECIE